MPTIAARTAPVSRRTGIGYWVSRVLAERTAAQVAFAPDAVHDLRVALRRCRSMADGFREVDRHPGWKKMRRAGKALFAALGELRDVQVLQEWIQQFAAESPAAGQRLAAYCGAREQELKSKAAVVLHAFDERSWRAWSDELQQRAERFPAGSDVFQLLALQKWEAARRLHAIALRNRSKSSFHQLRIGIKRFRYLVENFLPSQHELWGKDLKRLQDVLGEVHDLDVLWETACAQNAFANDGERRQWRDVVQRERARRLITYREKMVGRGSLWRQWRAGLPSGEALRRTIVRRFDSWAGSAGDRQAHARRVRAFSLRLYDELAKAGLLTCDELDGVDCRDVLEVASTVHDVGRGKSVHAPHKRARRIVQKLTPPPGWKSMHLEMAALVARYHRGAFPTSSHRSFRAMPPKARRAVEELAAVLRLADTFAGEPSIQRVSAAKRGGVILIRALSYDPRSKVAQDVAAARHGLEAITGLPVFVTADAADR